MAEKTYTATITSRENDYSDYEDGGSGKKYKQSKVANATDVIVTERNGLYSFNTIDGRYYIATSEVYSIHFTENTTSA